MALPALQVRHNLWTSWEALQVNAGGPCRSMQEGRSSFGWSFLFDIIVNIVIDALLSQLLK